MRGCLLISRTMASIASLSKLTVSSAGPSLVSASSTAHIDSRFLLSARTTCIFSAGLPSSFLKSRNSLREGTLGARGFILHKSPKIKSRSMTSASLETQTDNRQYFALIYDYVPDILEKRGPHRPGHIAVAREEEAEGKMCLGGAWGDPVDGALFIFLVNSADEVQKFVDRDPYVSNGLVTKIDIRPVAAAVGTWITAAKK
ncbi:uncharacterized protein [Physcomitrium patens]|uniref:YCII-related domain-containing protein n=1 Tax=Physcomitrium patens TaxID=3218 RepID=A0A2K1K357_PHYPA|nr:uncharacterized protein LOC112286349 [Physcomitrium patens]PNR48210.1 hypothetical protein PHYPA_012685 [Physcomitrium patens]|eukprot:XP_024383916.1 uncharacterized protein LOC112286349 [Physcomitrella patens]